MEKLLIVKILILLIVLCIKNDARLEQKQVEHQCAAQYWQDMWFSHIRMIIRRKKHWITKGDYCNNISNYRLYDNLKTIPTLMGCGYGQSLTDFLRVTTYTVNECKTMSQIGHGNAGDCWIKLKERLDAGKSVISTLLGAFIQINSLNRRTQLSDFYYDLLPITKCLKDHCSSVENILQEEEHESFNQQIMFFANTLGERLGKFCKPPHNLLTLTILKGDYENENTGVSYENTMGDRYTFLIDKLNSYTKYIGDHLQSLGFITNEGDVYYQGPNKSDIKNDATKNLKDVLVSHICNAQHWQNMWFKEIFMNSVTHRGWMKIGDYCNKSDNFPPVSNLKTISTLMGCGYGQSITDFLRVTTYTVNECKTMSQIKHGNAGDCWIKLKERLDAGELAVRKILGAFDLIGSLYGNIRIELYNDLRAIQKFLKDRGPIVQNSLVEPEDTGFTVQSLHYANVLGVRLNDGCKPPHNMLTLPQLIMQYEKESTTGVLYQNNVGNRYKYLIDKLNSYTHYIDNHLQSLGFITHEGVVSYQGPNESG